MADRILLLRTLRAAGPAPVAVLVALALARALLPAASAVAMALLVARVAGGDRLWPALLVLLGLVLSGHLVDAFIRPVRTLVKARIDGVHRAEVARLCAQAPRIAELEEPEVQDLVRAVRAEPVNWTERTPGDGATAQVMVLAKWVGALSASAVVGAYAWWLVPILLVPVIAARMVNRRTRLAYARLWAEGLRGARRVDGWRSTLTSAAEAKEQRVYGFGEWAVQRQVHAMHVAYDEMWRRRFWLRDGLVLALMGIPLGVVYTVVAVGVSDGRATVAMETAVLAAGFALLLVVVGANLEVDVDGAIRVLVALRQLRERLPDAAAGTGPPTASPTAPAAAPAPGRIELRGIRFRYPGSDRPVLDGLDLAVEPGELLAIVGFNGAGKSTLIKLLAGLYEPDTGTITAGGVDLRELGPAAWRERISVVFQDFVRYGLPLADNISLGHATVPPDRAAIEAAADEAGLRPVLQRLPDGWDTPLARHRTGGVDLSGGQWQQVVLARALYAVHTGATLLVLDEPTAHLDVRSEFELFGRLAGRRRSTSIVLISHRLSTVRHADRIVLLDGGRITEAGTHDELMALGGGYARMFTIQADRFRRGFDDRIEEGVSP